MFTGSTPGQLLTSNIKTYSVSSSLPTLQAFVFSVDKAGRPTRNVALLVNLADAPVDVELSLAPRSHNAFAHTRSEWELTAAGGDMHAQHVLLNGAVSPLSMTADGSVEPTVWTGLVKDAGEPIVLVPRAVKIIVQQRI